MKISINGVDFSAEKYVKKWTDLALEATPATDGEITKNVQRLYELANQTKPEVRVFREYEDFLSHDWESIEEGIEESIEDSVYESVRERVKKRVREIVGASIGDGFGASVGERFGASVSARVCKSVGVNVGMSVVASVGKRFGASPLAGLWFWADELAYADVFVDAGVLSEEKAQEIEEYKRILSSQRLAVMTKDVAYVLVAPVIRLNEAGRLHSTDTYAVQWGNSGIYYLNGVEIPCEMTQ